MNDDFMIKPKKPRLTPAETPKQPAPLKIEVQPEPADAEVDLTDEHALGEESVLDVPELDMDDENNTDKGPTKSKKPKKKRRSPKQWFLDLPKKKKILVVVIAVLVLAGGSVGAFALMGGETPSVVSKKKETPKPKPTTVASALTGEQVKPELNERGISGIMIENHPDAWPQAGLGDAGVVFEAIAEGGISRFLALYQTEQPEYIGPVRSARPYYLDWLQGFDATLAHAGGSGEALARISNEGIRSMDHGANGAAYQRVSNRAAPHNLYTSMSAIDSIKEAKDWKKSTFKGFSRKKEKAATTPTAKSIDLAVSTGQYVAHFDYDAATNSYLRSQAGAPHVDEKSGKQLSSKVVVGMVVSWSQNGIYSVYQNIGSGPCVVFQDGVATEGIWEKASSKDQIIFKDARGNDLKLNPGKTWISAVRARGDITFAP